MVAAGTLDANLDNSGAVTAAGFTIHGRYTQQRGAALTANHLTVTGPVTLAGSLKPAPDQTATVIDNTGGEPITGTFGGLPEGATIDGYRITYRGGDGNDVVLIGGRTTGSPLDRAATGAGAARWPWWVTTVAALVLVLAALAVVVVVRRRSRRSPRHHAE